MVVDRIYFGCKNCKQLEVMPIDELTSSGTPICRQCDGDCAPLGPDYQDQINTLNSIRLSAPDQNIINAIVKDLQKEMSYLNDYRGLDAP